jgi:hypothetical protein
MLLEQGQQADKEALERGGMSAAGRELMDVWGRMDRGAIKSQEAFEQADRAARRRAGEGTAQ